MELKYDYWTGTMNQVLESLNRSLGQYHRHYRRVKIGVTNNPERRKNEHGRSKIKWDYMDVKYKTTSINFVTKLEIILINSHWDYIVNEIGGGGGPVGSGNQYLYVLLKK